MSVWGMCVCGCCVHVGVCTCTCEYVSMCVHYVPVHVSLWVRGLLETHVSVWVSFCLGAPDGPGQML